MPAENSSELVVQEQEVGNDAAGSISQQNSTEKFLVKHFYDSPNVKKYNARNVYFCTILQHDALPELKGYLLNDQNNIEGLVFPYCGKTLNDFILEPEKTNERYPELTFLTWAGELADVLEYLHSERVPHRDLTPDNILIREDRKLFLTGLGSARYVAEEMTMNHGKKWYMAPEEFKKSGEKNYCCKVDTYAFAMVWYFATTKKVPFAGVDSNLGKLLHLYTWSDKHLQKFEGKFTMIENKYPRPIFPPPSLNNPPYPYMQKLIEECWGHKAEDRPMMKDVKTRIENLVKDLQAKQQDPSPL